ncbi:MAG: response regulator, partial [Sulfurimonas sp.]|nr:response regulator [Sulfurimonas sp.]
IDEVDYLFRINGDDFVILNKEHFELSSYIDKLEEILIDTNVTIAYKYFNIKESNIVNIKDVEKIF